MSVSHYCYPVRLSEKQRQWLEAMVRMSNTPTKHYLVARRVLLMSDQCQSESSHTDGQIAEVLSISRRTVIRIKQRFAQENLEVALTGNFPREHPERRCLDGKGEAQLIHLACSKAPDGWHRWTLELLADQMAKLEYVEHISPETVRQALKNELKPWLVLSLERKTLTHRLKQDDGSFCRKKREEQNTRENHWITESVQLVGVVG
jgi:transposase